ncbi:MAG: esterase family protein [Oscillospiraceae bacterium]|jgi:S-formylglutathione hydrolase FrmB|nr:esterase family protein [Oscillospiraceae bacterium]
MAWLQIQFLSSSLMRKTSFNVLLPADGFPGMPPRPTPYKTLYLLHGFIGTSSDWLLNSQLEDLSEMYNLAIVMPSGENSFYVDAASGTSQFSKLIGDEIVAFTRKILPLSDKREDTFIGGLSMGGYGALYNGLKYHKTFGHIIALSSAIITATDALTASDEPNAMGLNRAYYETVFGDLTKLPSTDKNLNVLADRVLSEPHEPLDVYFACGETDFLIEPNRAFAKHLTDTEFPHTYEEGPGAHEWAFWNTYLRRGLERALPPPPSFGGPFAMPK